jgi:ABC-2 type transport system permease protein
MHPRIILAITRKDALDVLRNRSTLIALLSPFFIAALYWVLSIALQGNTTTVALYNPGHSALVSAQTLPGNGSWNIINVDSADAVRRMVDNNEQDVSAGFVVPPDADTVLRQGGRPDVQFYYHAAKISQFEQQIIIASLIAAGQQIAGQQPPVQVTATALHIPDDQKNAQQADFMKQIEGLFGMLTILVGLITTGLMLVPQLMVEEKEKKTMRMILASPASYGDVIAGKLLVGFGYTVLVSLLLLIIGRIPAAAIPLMLLFMLLGGIFFLLVGLTIGAASKTGTEVNSYGTVVFMLAMVPMLLDMPGLGLNSGPFATIVRVFPNYYLVDGMRRALEGTANLENTLLNAGVTVAVILVVFALASWLLRRQQFAAA